ncbi:MAG: preprotein translocase subunit YajC [Gemmatimonadales bacterium]|nr:MAG: preprotein translocase subunit YajC [Gemmatimonadales bacterium]
MLFGGLFAIFYFLLIRPQKKQQKAHDQMVANLAKGDEIVTVGGIVGLIIHLTEDRITIKTAGDTRLEIDRAKIGRRLSGGG